MLLVNNNSSQTRFNGQIKHVKYGFRYQITSKYKKNPNYNPQVQNKWGTMGGGEGGEEADTLYLTTLLLDGDKA